MEFKNKPPKWDAAGREPNADLQREGFKAGYKPPAPYFNYLFNRTTESIKEIQAGLSNVDNTADKDKPISDLQKAAIDNNSISGKVTGNYATITDAADAPFNNINVYGASKQNVTTGANILDVANTGTFLNNQGSSKTGVMLPITEDGTYTYFIKDTITAYIGYTDSLTANATHFASCLKDKPASGNVTLKAGQYFLIWFDTNVTIQDSTNYFVAKGENVPFEIYTGGKPAPNPDYPQVINSVGDDGNFSIKAYHHNFIDPNKITLGSNDTFKVLEDGYIITATGSVGYANTKCWLPAELAGHKIIVKYDAAEWLNMGTSNITAQLIYKTGGVSKYLPFTSTTATQLKVTLPKDANDMYIALYTNNSNGGLETPATITIKGLMVCLDIPNADNTWCKHQSVIADIKDLILCGIPVTSGGNYTDEKGQQWCCDEIDLVKGVHIQRLKKVSYNGSENWLKSVSSLDDYSYYLKAEDARRTSILCDRLGKKSGDNAYIGMSTTGSGIVAIVVNYQGYMSENTVEEFKNVMSNYPLEVAYVLAEPIVTPLPEEIIAEFNKLQTYTGVTNIFAADNAGMTVDYFKNTDNGKATAIMATKINGLYSILGEMSSLLDDIVGGA